MDDIIEILNNNNLYDSAYWNCEIKTNNISKFLDTYKSNSTKKNFFPKDIQRNKDGSIILDNIPYIIGNVYVGGDNNPFWVLLNNGSKILLKDVSNKTIELELLIMYLLKELDISCANYDKVLMGDKTYLASNSFLSNNETIKPILPVCGYNLKQNIKIAKEYNAEIFYLKTVLIDRLIGNIDRYANFGIIQSNHVNKRLSQNRIAPLFDNADKSLNKYNEHIQLFPGINNKDDINTVISYLLKYDYIDNFIKKIYKNVSLEKCAILLEKEKNITVSSNNYNLLESYFKYSEADINEALKDNGKSYIIRLT